MVIPSSTSSLGQFRNSNDFSFGGTVSSSSSSCTSSCFGGNYNRGEVPTFGFGDQCRGSALASYYETPETDANCGYSTPKIKSISAMPVYRDKSHAELRFEDYARLRAGSSFSNQTSPFAPPVFASSSPLSYGSSSGPAFAPIIGASTRPLFGVTSSSGSGGLFGNISSFDKAPRSSDSGASFSTIFGVPNTSEIGFSFTPKTVAHSESGQGSANSIFGVSNVPPFASPSGFSSTFGVPETVVHSESGHGSTNSLFGVSNVSPFASTSGFSSTFGVPKTLVHSESGHALGQFHNTNGFSFGGTINSSSSSLFGTSSRFGGNYNCGDVSTFGFGNQCRGSAVASYSETPEIDVNCGYATLKMKSISAMPVYRDKSHEELRFEDYTRRRAGSSFSNQTPQNTVQQFAPPVFASSSSNTFSFAPIFGSSTSPLFGVTSSSGSGGLFGSITNVDKAPRSSDSGGSFPTIFGVPNTSGTSFSFTPKTESGHGSTTSLFGVSSVPPFASTIGFSSTFKVPKTVPHSESDHGSTTSIFGVSNVPPFASTSGFSSTFGVPETVVHPESGHGSTNSIFGVSNVPPFASTSGFSSTFGFPSSFVPQGSRIPGFSIRSSTPLWSTSVSADVSLSGPESNCAIAPPSTSKFNFSSSSATGAQETLGIGPTNGNQGSRVASYTATREVINGVDTGIPLQSISAMPIYKDKSHEELRFEDYEFRKTVSGHTSWSGRTLDSSSANIFSVPRLSNQSTLVTNNNTTMFTDSTLSPSVNPFSPPNLYNSQLKTVSPSQPSQASSGTMLMPEVSNQNINGQQYFASSTVGTQPTVVVNPFATRFAFDGSSAVTSTQLGISSLQASEKVPCIQKTIMIPRIRHVSSSPNCLPAQRRNSCKPKVPFFSDEVDRPGPTDPFLQRENPGAWIGFRISRGSCSEGWENKVCSNPSFKISINLTEVSDDTSVQEEGSSTTSKFEQDDAAVIERYKAEVSALMPKLQDKEYYTEPSLQELAEKEMADPGYCSRVNNFVVGRREYGSVKFVGETDIRFLDIESIIRFNNREVIVYVDDRKKPPVGQGLNKAAEISLLNVKCISKQTGKQYVDGPPVRSYEEMLRKKASELGVEFISYDPVQGEWKFSVEHF